MISREKFNEYYEDLCNLVDELSYYYEDLDIAIDEYNQSQKTDNDKETLQEEAKKVANRIIDEFNNCIFKDEKFHELCKNVVELDIINNCIYRIEDILENRITKRV